MIATLIIIVFISNVAFLYIGYVMGKQDGEEIGINSIKEDDK